METKQSINSASWKKSVLWVVLAMVCFQAAYSSLKYPATWLFMFGYAYFLVRLTEQPSVRRAFYFGLAAGYLCYAPQLFFMWNIFGPFAFMLWLVLAFWIGMFTAIICGVARRFGRARAAWLTPIVWTGLEYFRSELYYLKFSWMNVGYALPPFVNGIGMYGVGFAVLSVAVLLHFRKAIKITLVQLLVITAFIAVLLALYLASLADTKSHIPKTVGITGIQMEFPSESILPKVLDHALAKNTNSPIFVLSEYSLKDGVPDALKDWCREHSRYLVVGGEEFVTNDIYCNTAFVVGTNGDIVFKQAKSVPIQFFKDGLPAKKQALWDSPWGKIGICICYDLSYTRVTDELVRQGAQLIIVPTMDVENWGRHQHELHSRVAPVRAAEYGVPIFRLASSGISQAVTRSGQVIAQASMPGPGEMLSAEMRLPLKGSLPLDRYFAPVCTAIVVVMVGALLFLEWKFKAPK